MKKCRENCNLPYEYKDEFSIDFLHFAQVFLLTFKVPIIKLVDSAIYFFLFTASRSQCVCMCECEGSDEVSYTSSDAQEQRENEANESHGIEGIACETH